MNTVRAAPSALSLRMVTLALALAVLAVLAPAASAPAHASGSAEASFVAAANAERAAVGLPALRVADDLVAVARRHSRRMADGTHLHHNPALASDVGGWELVGENVGHGPEVAELHAAFMASPSHRANLVHREFSEIGIGVVVDDLGDIWVTQVFRLPFAAPASAPPAEPEPEATPAAEPLPEPSVEPSPANEPPADPAPQVEVVERAVPDVVPTADRISVVLARIDAADDEVVLAGDATAPVAGHDEVVHAARR